MGIIADCFDETINFIDLNVHFDLSSNKIELSFAQGINNRTFKSKSS